MGQHQPNLCWTLYSEWIAKQPRLQSADQLVVDRWKYMPSLFSHFEWRQETYITNTQWSIWILVFNSSYAANLSSCPVPLSTPAFCFFFWGSGSGSGRALLLLFSCMYSSSQSQDLKTWLRFKRAHVHTAYMLHRMITDNPVHYGPYFCTRLLFLPIL